MSCKICLSDDRADTGYCWKCRSAPSEYGLTTNFEGFHTKHMAVKAIQEACLGLSIVLFVLFAVALSWLCTLVWTINAICLFLSLKKNAKNYEELRNFFAEARKAIESGTTKGLFEKHGLFGDAVDN